MTLSLTSPLRRLTPQERERLEYISGARAPVELQMAEEDAYARGVEDGQAKGYELGYGDGYNDGLQD